MNHIVTFCEYRLQNIHNNIQHGYDFHDCFICNHRSESEDMDAFEVSISCQFHHQLNLTPEASNTDRNDIGRAADCDREDQNDEDVDENGNVYLPQQ
ncbi:hypothetical protein PoB_002756900 [Plakobranchus ocellatus]|uniref:Uncharacterized protein n=1 Tax=Plakobranchus ocellatus TaxID=259542 RepID=A0AAV4A4C5_9GAST|nr:hypothetical protein PoB_002756900 [Plakobranchus ocellatus]